MLSEMLRTSRALALWPLLAACGDTTATLDSGGPASSDLGPQDLGITVDTGPARADLGFADGGEVDASAPDSGVPDMGMANGLCPPQAPFGLRAGEVFPELRLPDCDGQLVNLHESCGRKAAYFFVYADW